jgi:membrane protease YdiL (CAAX protease family)
VWEELGWAGYFQRRAVARWGIPNGSIVTALFFTAIHLPLAFDCVGSLGQAGLQVTMLAGLAIGFRLVIAYIDGWTGSLLVIGLFHSSYNASEAVLQASHDWVRSAVVAAVGLALVAIRSRRPSQVASAYRGEP